MNRLSRRAVFAGTVAAATCAVLPAASARAAGSHGMLRLSGVVTAVDGSSLPFNETTALAWEQDGAGVLVERRRTRRQIFQAERVIEVVWDDVVTTEISGGEIAGEWRTAGLKRLGGAFAAGPLVWRGAGVVTSWRVEG